MGTTNLAAIYSNGGNHWNILGFNFTKRDALSSVYKISMEQIHPGREITAGQRTMSGQNAELSAQILTLPVILTAHFR